MERELRPGADHRRHLRPRGRAGGAASPATWPRTTASSPRPPPRRLARGPSREPVRLRLRAAGVRLPADLRQGALPAGALLPRGGRAGATRATPTPGRCSPSPTWTPRATGWSSRPRRPARWRPAWRRRCARWRWRRTGCGPGRRWRRCASRSGDYDEAERVQRRAIALNPAQPGEPGAARLAADGAGALGRGRHATCRTRSTAASACPPGTTSTLASALYLKGDVAAGARRRRARQGGLLRDRLRHAGDHRGRGRARRRRRGPTSTRRCGRRPTWGATRGRSGPTSGARTRSSTGSTRAWPWRGSRRHGRQREARRARDRRRPRCTPTTSCCSRGRSRRPARRRLFSGRVARIGDPRGERQPVPTSRARRGQHRPH